MRRSAMMMITAVATMVLIHSVNSFASEEKRGLKKAPVLLGSGKTELEREGVKSVFAALR